jgi:hypothetical protein
MNILRSLLLLGLVSSQFACTKPVGATCEADSDCGGSLLCLQIAASISDDACTEGGKVCTTACENDDDCNAENSEACTATCDDAVSVCLSRSTSDLPFSAECASDGECADGLSCLPLSTGTADACNETITVCTTACAADADCTSLGGSCNSQCDEAVEPACVAGG